MTSDLIHYHRRAQALISALPDVDWESDTLTCADLNRALDKRRKITPNKPLDSMTEPQYSTHQTRNGGRQDGATQSPARPDPDSNP